MYKKIIFLIFFIIFINLCFSNISADSLSTLLNNIYDEDLNIDKGLVEILLKSEIKMELLSLSNQLKYSLIMSKYYENVQDYEKTLHYLKESENIINQVKKKELNINLLLLEKKYKNNEKLARNREINNYSKKLNLILKKSNKFVKFVLLFLIMTFSWIGLIILNFSKIIVKRDQLNKELVQSEQRLTKLINDIELLTKGELIKGKEEDIDLPESKNERIIRNGYIKYKDDNVAMFTHDFRNPLAILKANVQFYNNYCLKADSEAKFLGNKIIDHILTFNRSIGLFLEFSKIGKASIKSGDIVKIVRKIISDEHYEKCIIHIVALKDKMIIMFDQRMLKCALIQLLKNAIESAAEDALEIKIILEERIDSIAIYVQDNARGIPKSIKYKVIEPFVSTKPFHLGLGLTLAKLNLEAINGTIEILNSNDDGTALLILINKARSL